MHNPKLTHDEHQEIDAIEAYCVRCKQTVVMENATPVWTKRGTPGTRGECEICGTTVFRMGRTEAHRGLVQPDVSQFKEIAGPPRRRGSRVQATYATYINYSPADLGTARQIAEDLNRTGIPTWFDDSQSANEVSWASGTHPALEDCSMMVVVLSGDALGSETVEQGWSYFRTHRKPVYIVLAEPVEVPDDLRRSPRFDFSQDYKTAFRELVHALASS